MNLPRIIRLALVLALLIAAAGLAAWWPARPTESTTAEASGVATASPEALGEIVLAIVASERDEFPELAAKPLVLVSSTVMACMQSMFDCTEVGLPDEDASVLGGTSALSPSERSRILQASLESVAIPCPPLAGVTCLSQAALAPIFPRRDWGDFQRRFPGGSVVTFSTPLISSDGMHAIVYSSSHCGGLCGGGQRVLLDRRDGRWVVLRREMRWVS